MVISENYKAKPEYVKSKTAAWWDIDTCPIPDGYDARRIRPSIESALKDLGYYGPITITVMGNLEKTPAHVIQDLSSTGIIVKHALSTVVTTLFFDELLAFKRHNPSPASIMLISDKVEFELSFPLCRNQQSFPGYNLLRAYTYTTTVVSTLYSTADWLWESLLAADKHEARSDNFLRKCSTESVESASFECTSCFSTYPTVEIFTTHLLTKEHARNQDKIIESRKPGVVGPGKTTKRKVFRTDFRLLHYHLRGRRSRCEPWFVA